MAGNRGLVGLLALAVLVWGVAFGGGLTVAVLTSSVNVTATFETTDGLTAIDESIGSDPRCDRPRRERDGRRRGT